jgi:hypothetical protein
MAIGLINIPHIKTMAEREKEQQAIEQSKALGQLYQIRTLQAANQLAQEAKEAAAAQALIKRLRAEYNKLPTLQQGSPVDLGEGKLYTLATGLQMPSYNIQEPQTTPLEDLYTQAGLQTGYLPYVEKGYKIKQARQKEGKQLRIDVMERADKIVDKAIDIAKNTDVILANKYLENHKKNDPELKPFLENFKIIKINKKKNLTTFNFIPPHDMGEFKAGRKYRVTQDNDTGEPIRVIEMTPTLSEQKSVEFKELEDKIRRGEKLTSQEQRKYNALIGLKTEKPEKKLSFYTLSSNLQKTDRNIRKLNQELAISKQDPSVPEENIKMMTEEWKNLSLQRENILNKIKEDYPEKYKRLIKPKKDKVSDYIERHRYGSPRKGITIKGPFPTISSKGITIKGPFPTISSKGLY